MALQPVALLGVLGDARADGVILDRLAVEGQERHRGERLDGGCGRVLADEVAVAEIVAAGRQALAQAPLVGAREGQLDGAVGDDREAALGRALLGDGLAGLVVALGELAGEARQLGIPRRLKSGIARRDPERIARPPFSLERSMRPGLASTTARRLTR